MKNFESVYDIASYFSDELDKLHFPKPPSKPQRSDFSNHASYGTALDDFENVSAKTYREQQLAYKESVSNINVRFKDAVLLFLGISKHQKAEKLWSMAWDRGHSSGYSEIAMEAESLAELLTDQS